MDLSEWVGHSLSAANLLASFNDQSTVDHLVVYLRLLPSGDLQQNSKFLEHCIEHGWTIQGTLPAEGGATHARRAIAFSSWL